MVTVQILAYKVFITGYICSVPGEAPHIAEVFSHDIESVKSGSVANPEIASANYLIELYGGEIQEVTDEPVFNPEFVY